MERTIEETGEQQPEPQEEAQASLMQPPPTQARPVLRAPSARERREQIRRTRVTIRRVGPISVFKLSLIFYFCMMLIVFFGLLMLYGVMSAAGVISHLEDLIVGLGLSHAATGTFVVNGSWLFGRMFAVGCGLVVLAAVINVLASFLYNLISDVVGGLEVTLSEKPR